MTWIELRQMIQDAFQRRLNTTAPTAGHQGYTPALPFQQNAFGTLANDDSDEDSAAIVATQMAALTYRSQIMANTAANSSQQMNQYVQTLAHQQEQLHQNQHQIIKQLAALSFNQSVAGRGIGRQGRGPPPQALFAPIQFGGNNFWKPWGMRTWTWTRTWMWPWPARIYCRLCTPSHDYYGREDTSITGNAPSNRWWILCTPTPGARPSPLIFKPHKEVCQLECMLFLWVRSGRWPHQPDVPPTSEEARS
jgi:hypothetical protein